MSRHCAPLLIAVLLAAFLIGPAVAQQPSGAKAIFYSGEGPTVMPNTPAVSATPSAPSAAPAPAPRPSNNASQQAKAKKSPYVGISYWIDLTQRGGEAKRVATTHAFKSGDRIKISLQSNKDGYLYVLNLGSTGRSNLLFPTSAMNAGDNFISAGKTYTIPAETVIRFDNNPGEETVLLMLSTKPMNNLLPGIDPRGGAQTADATQKAIQVANSQGAKDLVLETESTGAQPASYMVAPAAALNRGELLTARFILKHN